MPESQAQVGLAGRVTRGESKAMPLDVAKEILQKMTGRKLSDLPEHKGKSSK